ncbi:class I SAM-dependent methyltransferase [Aliarcobacter cryaerophilus]|uniref:class I SAM-dependent methyltransferase n=1 Tax=Aliarcobacter cryaerophilus TaxID=28198 RepID=UPI0021B55DBC|nr:class I SAM-dependent methyltransferase [Aliarcobacter cryaerophilus]
MTKLKYFYNLSATGYGIEKIMIPLIYNFLNEMKNKDRQIKVLDFGCSQKPYQYLFNNYDNVIEYIGVDVYQGEKVDVVYDGNRLPFEDGYFDFVFSSSVLEHVEDLDNSLNEINRVLKVGGITVHSVPFINHIHGTPYDFHRPTFYGWLSKFKRANFNNIEVKNTDSRYCCLMNLITSQINAFLINIAKNLLSKKQQGDKRKNIFEGDASPENQKSKKLKIMYLLLALNPINFLLGLSCWISNLFPSNNNKELKITSAYVIKAMK